jgi:arylsulfatase A-like enzyme
MLSPHITAAGIFVPIMLWSPAALPAGAKEPSAAPRPNIVLILADDMGYADAGVHGCKDIPTPHIDSIARGGIRFSDAYANAAVCSPTRAALMSGMYQQRHGNEDLAEITGPLPRQVTTLPQRLRAAGYATALIGKWHLGQDEGFTPLDRGFDRFFGFLGGGHFYFPEGKPKTKDMDETMLRHIDNYSAPLLRDREPLKERRYLTDAFAGESAAYIASRRDNPQPFFLLTAFNAVHTPMEATQKYLDRFPDIADPKRRTYAGMLSAMDDAVGEIISALKACGQLENTLLIFTNDNGGASVNASKNAPLRGWKAGMFEGGLRVPLLMQWPGVIEPGSVYSHPVMTFDVTSTVLAAAGADQGGLDGVDLLPCLAGNRAPHETLFWRCRTRKTHAVRHADWKLV